MRTRSDLQELVDSPNETLDVEYKQWLDISSDNNEIRADIARHIAALANHGGGTIVFGFTDTMQFPGPNPFPKVTYDRDLIASIVKKYLDPTFQCDVHIIKSASGHDHPVVIVPPHGAVPICAKASGPDVDGRTKGIIQGTYYTRKAGPESARIQTPDEWAPIIRRCAMHERSAILGAIDATLRGASIPASPGEALKTWHDAAHAVFLKDIAEHKALSARARCHFQLSYAIERGDGQELDSNKLIEILCQVNREVNDIGSNIWNMFYPYTREEIKPSFTTDPTSGLGEHDFLECSLLRDSKPYTLSIDMWRVSRDGKATFIDEYWEDDAALNRQFNLKVGTWFSPNMLVRTLAEFVRHARGLSERFEAPTTLSFRCEWHGLTSRHIGDPWALWHDYVAARGDHRVATGAWPVSTLASGWAEIVADLAAPLMRLFTTDFVITPEWVRGQLPTWQRR